MCRISAKDLKWWAHRSPLPFYFDLTCTVRSQPTEAESHGQDAHPANSGPTERGVLRGGHKTPLTALVFLCSHSLERVRVGCTPCQRQLGRNAVALHHTARVLDCCYLLTLIAHRCLSWEYLLARGGHKHPWSPGPNPVDLTSCTMAARIWQYAPVPAEGESCGRPVEMLASQVHTPEREPRARETETHLCNSLAIQVRMEGGLWAWFGFQSLLGTRGLLVFEEENALN